jgi:hypothetical protein
MIVLALHGISVIIIKKEQKNASGSYSNSFLLFFCFVCLFVCLFVYLRALKLGILYTILCDQAPGLHWKNCQWSTHRQSVSSVFFFEARTIFLYSPSTANFGCISYMLLGEYKEYLLYALWVAILPCLIRHVQL